MLDEVPLLDIEEFVLSLSGVVAALRDLTLSLLGPASRNATAWEAAIILFGTCLPNLRRLDIQDIHGERTMWAPKLPTEVVR